RGWGRGGGGGRDVRRARDAGGDFGRLVLHERALRLLASSPYTFRNRHVQRSGGHVISTLACGATFATPTIGDQRTCVTMLSGTWICAAASKPRLSDPPS